MYEHLTDHMDIEKEINALKYHQKVANELYRLGWLSISEKDTIVEGLRAAITQYWIFYEEVHRKTFPIGKLSE